MTSQNPYAAPQADFDSGAQANPELAKIEAIIKDAGQFWLAILMCIFCSGLGGVIIGPWYLVRLFQWKSIARSQPQLLDPNVPRGSLEQRFQSAKLKLIVGISFGAVILLLVVVFLAVTVVFAPNPG